MDHVDPPAPDGDPSLPELPTLPGTTGGEEHTLRPQPPPSTGRERRWRLVGRDALDHAVADALGQALQGEFGTHSPAVLTPEALESLQARFLHEFRARIRGGGRSLRAISKRDFLNELQAANDELLKRRDETKQELEELVRKVRALESGAAPGGETPGLRAAEVRARVLSFLEERLSRARTRDELGRGLLEFASALVAEDRKRRGVDDDASTPEQLDRYRRRIEKLRSALSSTEGQLEELERRAESAPEGAVTPLARAVLAGRESDEHRLAVMQRLFEENIALREALRRA